MYPGWLLSCEKALEKVGASGLWGGGFSPFLSGGVALGIVSRGLYRQYRAGLAGASRLARRGAVFRDSAPNGDALAIALVCHPTPVGMPACCATDQLRAGVLRRRFAAHLPGCRNPDGGTDLSCAAAITGLNCCGRHGDSDGYPLHWMDAVMPNP